MEEIDALIAAGADRTDWKRLAEMKDEDIDCSDIPELDDEWFRNAAVIFPKEGKARITMRLDLDILEFFQKQGKGYQTRMHAVLRSYVDAQRRKPKS